MGDLTESLTPSTVTASSSNPRPMPVREDCWSEDATSTLVDAWGRRYVELNRGNLRQKDWQEVADAVNALHGHTKKTHRTDVQCKNRVDTIKKKYKAEKPRVSAGYGVSTWPFYDRLDSLIGSASSSSAVKKPSPPSISPPVAVPLPIAYRKPSPSPARPVVTAVALPQKRTASMAALNERSFRMNYSAIAAAAAAENNDNDDEDEPDEDDDNEEAEVEEAERDSEGELGNGGGERGGGGIGGEGLKRLAKAIERFGDVYQRVENDKIRQMLDLEKQKMQFAMDLEVQRMRMFVDTQVQLERIKHGKRSGSNDIYS